VYVLCLTFVFYSIRKIRNKVTKKKCNLIQNLTYNKICLTQIINIMATKFETLNEAFEEATLQAEGHESSMKAPIFKNEDGTYEVGKMQNENCSDISDGTFEEIGSVAGWDVRVYDFGENSEEMTNEDKAQEVFNENRTEWFNLFCECYEIAE